MPGIFNTGRDVSLDFVGPNGPINVSLLTDFEAKQDITNLKSAGLDGVTRFENVPDGWSGSFGVDRANRALDDLIYALEQQYYNGTTITKATITQTIRETDGTISQWRYINVVLHMDNAGGFKKDSKVEQKISFMASFRQKVQ